MQVSPSYCCHSGSRDAPAFGYKVHRGSESYHIAAFVKFGDLLPGCAQASKPEKECIRREGEFELQHKERPPRNRNKHN